MKFWKSENLIMKKGYSIMLISIRMFEQNTYIPRKLDNLLFRFYKSLGFEKDKSQ